MQVPFLIKRSNPLSPQKSKFQKFELEINDGATILDGLNYVRECLDRTLGFRKACRAAICGSCAIRINGRAKLACNTQIEQEFTKFGEIKIEPLKSLKVIKDLIVDFEPFWKQMKEIKPWLIPKKNQPMKENLITPEEAEKVEKAATCVMCAACYSDCPAVSFDKNFLGPAAAVKMYRFVEDNRDSARKERLKMLNKLGIWACAHAETCVSRCPKEIMPMELISLLREISIKEGIKNSDGARHVNSIYKSIKRCGEMDEARLPLDTLGPIRVMKQWKLALRLLRHGKMPPMRVRKIKGIEEVRKIYKKMSNYE